MMRILLPLLFLSTLVAAQPLPVKEERLGAWHYLYPLEFHPGGDPKHRRPFSTPTVLPFGAEKSRIATLLPGSEKLAEFKGGDFHDLQLPEEWAPVSLGADREGKLYCLVQHAEKFLHTPAEAKGRWLISLGTGGWDAPMAIPYSDCDRLEFDTENRLWALGPDPSIGFFSGGKWSTYAYSSDRKLQFLPLRLTQNGAEGVTLFAYDPVPVLAKEISRLTGTLTFSNGRFIRLAGAKTAAAITAESRRYAEPLREPGFDRAHGYVFHIEALNGRSHGPTTALHAAGHVFVSLGNDGLAWADADELASTPPLATDEWEAVNDVTVPPVAAPSGNLWVGRGSKLLEIGAKEAKTMEGVLPEIREGTIDFDPLGRPWVMSWHGSTEGPAVVADHGTLRSYQNFAAALQAESAILAPGRIFPFALKTPAGLLAFGGGYFNEVTIIDTKVVRLFTPQQIAHSPDDPHAGHGYNRLRGAEPWYDAKGVIHANVDGLGQAYDPVRRAWSSMNPDDLPMSALPPVPPERGTFSGAFRGDIEFEGHHRIAFHGFHFFLVKEGGEQPLDAGLNPLAHYPFWTDWYSSPGATAPRMDPAGHLWISALGSYADNQKWLVLRKPAW